MKNLTSILGVLAVSTILVVAGEDKKMVVPEDIAVSSDQNQENDWSLELGTGIQWSNVRAGGEDAYTMIPGNFTAGLKLDDVGLDDFAGGIFRGYSEFLFQGYGYALTNSPDAESRIFGGNVGPRYNFVQPGWKLVPYVEGLVGLGFADSNPRVDNAGNAHGLGEDFNFSFSVGAGARYDINDTWFARAGILYTHFSNAGLSEPAHPNRPIDALGPMISVGFWL